jgi:hypothetical protein
MLSPVASNARRAASALMVTSDLVMLAWTGKSGQSL